MESPEQKPKRILSFNDLKDKKGIRWTRQHTWREVKARRFPEPVRLGANTIAWVEDEIDAWLGQRIAERNTAA
jgi:prophage regulatory protein